MGLDGWRALHLKPVEHIRIRPGMSVGELLAQMGASGVLGAGRLGRAARIVAKMFSDPSCSVFLSLAGALVPGGMRLVLRDLVDKKLLTALVTTGANVVHDILEALGFRHYVGTFRADDVRLLSELARLGYREVSLSYKVLEKLPRVLREGEWKVTVVLWMNNIIDIEPRDTRKINYGVGVDIGTTKLALFLVNLNDGTLLYPVGTMNPQIPYGEDVMSRISYAMQGESNLKKLQEVIVEGINQLITEAVKIANINKDNIYEVVVVGNTAMHHLFLAVSYTHLTLPTTERV